MKTLYTNEGPPGQYGSIQIFHSPVVAQEQVHIHMCVCSMCSLIQVKTKACTFAFSHQQAACLRGIPYPLSRATLKLTKDRNKGR